MFADFGDEAREVFPSYGFVKVFPIERRDAWVRHDGFQTCRVTGVQCLWGDETGNREATLTHFVKDGGIVGRGVPRHDGEEFFHREKIRGGQERKQRDKKPMTATENFHAPDVTRSGKSLKPCLFLQI